MMYFIIIMYTIWIGSIAILTFLEYRHKKDKE
jgi:hypothetical protein